jgi:hypothetical protein
MREKGRIFIQAECLQVARRQPGCGALQSVLIAPILPQAGDPNWEVVSFLPDLPPLARLEAIRAIAPLRQKYTLVARQPPNDPGERDSKTVSQRPSRVNRK